METRVAIKEFLWAIRPKLAHGDARTAATVSRTPHGSLPSHTTRQPAVPHDTSFAARTPDDAG